MIVDNFCTFMFCVSLVDFLVVDGLVIMYTIASISLVDILSGGALVI